MSVYEIIRKTITNNKVLVKNFSSLSILQISQYVFPLITFPYLVRVLGPDGFGLIAFATAFVSYFNIITDYGFNLSATRDISINRNNVKKINRIFNSVLSVKIILFLLSTLIFLPIVFGIPKFKQDYEIYLVSYISVFGVTIFPIWFFQGYEKMGFITIINVFVKVIWVLSVFLFIKSSSDLLMLVFLNSISSVLIGIVGFLTVSVYFKINFRFANTLEIINETKKGLLFFISNISISLYTISTTFILGLFASNSMVGYFSAADKIRQAVQNLTSISGRTIFPHVANEFSKSKSAAISFIKKYTLIMGIVSFIVCLALFLTADKMVYFILGENYEESILILKIISFLPFIILLSNIGGIQIMVNLNYKYEFFLIFLTSSIFSLIISFILVPNYFGLGSAISILITELFVTSIIGFFLYKRKIFV